MPKVVDHEERRRAIGDVVLRLVASEGARAATFRRVAGEMGLSVGAVQYYFDSAQAMLDGAFAQIGARREQRVRDEIARLGREPTEREILYASMVTGLPLDEERRIECLAEAAWVIRAGGGTGSDPSDKLPELLDLYRGLLDAAQAKGLVCEDIEPALEAQVLWALVAVQSRTLTLGARSTQDVLGVIDYHLNRVFCG